MNQQIHGAYWKPILVWLFRRAYATQLVTFLLVLWVNPFISGSGEAVAQSRPDPTPKRSHCLSSLVPLKRSWDEEQTVDINAEFNDYAAIYLDSASADCKAMAADTLAEKIKGTLQFAEAGGNVITPFGTQTHPFHNWLWGAAITHLFAAALELRYSGLEVSSHLLDKVRDTFENIPDSQDHGCSNPANGCMDDFALTASGFAWAAAYEAQAGRNPRLLIDRATRLLSNAFAPLSSGGGVCYYVTGSDPVRCDGNRAGLASGRVRIIGIGHGQENPNYGLGLMTAVASTCLGLYLAGQPCDFQTVDPATGLTWRQIAIELLLHARTKTGTNPSAFAADCLDLQRPSGPRCLCADVFGYSPNLFPLYRFYRWKIGYQFEHFASSDFHFERFDPNYEFRQSETMLDRHSFWGLNRLVFYHLYAHEAWPGGTLNTHYKQLRCWWEGCLIQK